MLKDNMAPVCLFVYNKVEELVKVVESLSCNHGSENTKLYIFSDGWRNEIDKANVIQVRDYIKSIRGFKTIEIVESEVNKGLAKSIRSGVDIVINQHGKVIVVEDDLITSRNFLTFMNSSLDRFSSDPAVFSISGYTPKIETSKYKGIDAFFWGRPHSWGWATWKDRWDLVDWDIPNWDKLKIDPIYSKKIKAHGSDLINMMDKSKTGSINSWYIRFCISQIIHGGQTVYPMKSKVINNGFIELATHCSTYNREKVDFDTTGNMSFTFPIEIEVNEDIGKQMYALRSYLYRVQSRLLTQLMKFKLIKQRKLTFEN